MNIGIDARVLEKQMTGIGRYLSDILKGVASGDKKNKYTLFSTNEFRFSKEDNINPDHFKFIFSGNKALPNKLYSPYWLNFTLPTLIEKSKIDIFFSPNNLLPIKKLKCKSVITVHDVFHLIDKKYHPFFYRKYMNLQLPYSVKNADVVVAISESTKNDLIKYFKVSEEKIKTIYRAADNKFKPITVTEFDRKRLKLPDKYLLYVGMIENRKNIMGILKTADLLFLNKPEIKFVLVGRSGHGFKEIDKEIKRRENVLYLNYFPESEIVNIYNLAFLFFFPSYYEGFGLPPLEAMQCGLPVICSNIASLREVVGKNGFLREPEDYDGFVDDIISLIDNPALYSEMKYRSLYQSRLFSANESLEKLLEIFNDC